MINQIFRWVGMPLRLVVFMGFVAVTGLITTASSLFCSDPEREFQELGWEVQDWAGWVWTSDYGD